MTRPFLKYGAHRATGSDGEAHRASGERRYTTSYRPTPRRPASRPRRTPSMNSYLARLLGFAAPTMGFVLALHVQREQGWGEMLDGLVSGLAFVLPFAAAVALRARYAPAPAGATPRGG